MIAICLMIDFFPVIVENSVFCGGKQITAKRQVDIYISPVFPDFGKNFLYYFFGIVSAAEIAKRKIIHPFDIIIVYPFESRIIAIDKFYEEFSFFLF